MPIRLILAALCAVLLSTAADARPRHTSPYQGEVGCSDPVMRPCQIVSKSDASRFPKSSSHVKHMTDGLHRVMAQGAGRAAGLSRFIRGRLVCAANVGAALAARGIRGTGSRVAKSYLRWGHASGPVPGAVAVFSRRGGGHVAIVDHVEPDGTVIYLNPSSRRQAWQVGPYRRRPIAYRVAGGEW